MPKEALNALKKERNVRIRETLKDKKKRSGLSWAVKKTAGLGLLAALLIEITVCQFSFWTSLENQGEDLMERAKLTEHYVLAEEMELADGRSPEEFLAAAAGEEEALEGQVYTDAEGYVHVPGGSMLISVRDVDEVLEQIRLDIRIPEGYQVLAEVFVQDEGNAYVYPLGDGRVLLPGVPENGTMKLHPYGAVKNLYIRLQRADAYGKGAKDTLGELVLSLDGLEANGRIPFSFRTGRMCVWWALAVFLYGLRAKSRIHGIGFLAETKAGQRKRLAAVFLVTGALLAAVFVLVRINPACRSNLALHHAQYQELAEALAQGSFSVGEADPALAAAENPYDTIVLQAGQIPYRADYAYYEENYYVYFGIVPVLLLYLPYYMLTGGALPNYAAVFVFLAGFVIACAGLVYELMKRYFQRLPFYLWGVGVFVLTGSYSAFYLLIRPDLYHVPIAASYFFAAAGLWLYLAGQNRKKGQRAQRTALYAAGSLCMALTAGCRAQFVLFAALVPVIFWKEICGMLPQKMRAKALQKAGGKALQKADGEALQKMRAGAGKAEKGIVGFGAGELAALILPYVLVAAGLMYYNAARFGSPFDFGAAYSLTSNDMTHRGFSLERILYGLWYFLFQPPQLSAKFPYLNGVLLETDYLGKMVTESSFGGVFLCSLFFVPMLFLRRYVKSGAMKKELLWFTGVCVFLSVLIGAVDANGAGILIRYSCDVSFGLFLAAIPALFGAAAYAREKGGYSIFAAWLKAAVLFQAGFLLLMLVNRDGSVNLLTGNPQLYYSIQSALRW